MARLARLIQLRDLVARFRKPLLKGFNLKAVTFFFLLGGLLLSADGYASSFLDERIFPMAIKISQQFEGHDNEKKDDAAQLEKVVQPSTSFYGVPTRQGGHDLWNVIA
jgi:hypothetical protein